MVSHRYGHRTAVSLMLLGCALTACVARTVPERHSDYGVETAIEALASEVQHLVDALTAACMSAAGYDQLELAEGLRPRGRALAFSGMVYWHPLEAGPTTQAEARQFGLLGVSLAFQQPLAGDVVGKDASFQDELKRCHRQVSTTAGRDVFGDLNAWVRKQSEIRSAFIETASPDVLPLLAEQIDCFAARVGVSPDVLAGGDYRELLGALGIAEGEWSLYHAPDPPAGELLVIPRSAGRYGPTEAEISVAEDFVACANETELDASVQGAQLPAREFVLRDYASEISEFQAILSRARDNLKGNR